MHAVVVYESMFGNTRRVAEAIGRGLREAGSQDVVVIPLESATGESPGLAEVAGADLLVVGGPTHLHGMSRPSSREAAVEMTRKPYAPVSLDEHAPGPGLREWLEGLPRGNSSAAAFDTRINGPLSGHASKGIGRKLREHGYSLASRPHSFVVDSQNHLRAGEEASAFAWGQELATMVRGRAAARGL